MFVENGLSWKSSTKNERDAFVQAQDWTPATKQQQQWLVNRRAGGSDAGYVQQEDDDDVGRRGDRRLGGQNQLQNVGSEAQASAWAEARQGVEI